MTKGSGVQVQRGFLVRVPGTWGGPALVSANYCLQRLRELTGLLKRDDLVIRIAEAVYFFCINCAFSVFR